MLLLFGLTAIVTGSVMPKELEMARLVRSVAVAVRATIGTFGNKALSILS